MDEIIQVKSFVRCNGKYLVLKKIKDIHKDHQGAWEVPGGKVNQDETVRQAVLREIFEETGLQCTILAQFETLSIQKDNIKTKTHVFLAQAPSFDVVLSAEHSNYMWGTKQDFENLDNIVYKPFFLKYLEKSDQHI